MAGNGKWGRASSPSRDTREHPKDPSQLRERQEMDSIFPAGERVCVSLGMKSQFRGFFGFFYFAEILVLSRLIGHQIERGQ